MPRFPSIQILVTVLLLAAPSLAAEAEPAAPRDPCAYMHHESKAYFACMADQAAARERAEATTQVVQPVAIPASAPAPKS